MHPYIATCILVVVTLCKMSFASVTMITDRQQWLNLTGQHEFIGFSGYPNLTLITTQYQQQGVVFPDGDDFVLITGSFPTDGHGLASAAPFGQNGSIEMLFSDARHAVAFEFAGVLTVDLYSHGAHIYNSGPLIADETPFVGFISTGPFDSAKATDFLDSVVAIDNLYFGAPVPAPAAFAFLVLGTTISPTRRRRA